MYYTTAFALENRVKAKLGYTMVDPATVSAALQNPISGLTLNERLQEKQKAGYNQSEGYGYARTHCRRIVR